MAFYLRRAFEHEHDVWVFNDLRLAKNGDAAQIDHLLLHRSGMVVIESKSATGEIAVNQRGEWSRRIGACEQGMESPVVQARLQAQFLRRLMSENDERLLDGQLGGLLPKHFNRNWPVDVIVAVSDTGRISRGMEVPELLKADQVAERVRAIVDRHKRGRFSPNPLNPDALYVLKPVEIGRLVMFLQGSHAPLARAGDKAARVSSTARPRTGPTEPTCDPGHFERLRLVRLSLAKERDIAAFMVFSDKTLRLIAAALPRNEEDLLRISGVGPAKAKEYGAAFLEAIRALRTV